MFQRVFESICMLKVLFFVCRYITPSFWRLSLLDILYMLYFLTKNTMRQESTLGMVREGAQLTGVTLLAATQLLHPVEARADEVKARAQHLLTHSQAVGNHIYGLWANRGNVIGAYRVMTRLKHPVEKHKGMVEVVPGSLGKYEEADGSQVCDKGLEDKNIELEPMGENIYRVSGQPLVVVREIDGEATLFPGLYDAHTKKWKVKDFTLGFTLTKVPAEMHLWE